MGTCADKKKMSTFVAGALFGATSVISFLIGMGQGAPPPPPGVVEATAFVLRDKDGNERGRWFLRDGAADFQMRDRDGRSRLGLQVDQDPTLKFWGEKGEDCILMRQSIGAGSRLALLDGTTKSAVDLSVYKNLSRIDWVDGKGKGRITTVCGPGDEADVIVRDEAEKEVWTALPSPVKKK